jgi:hypothetical protein
MARELEKRHQGRILEAAAEALLEVGRRVDGAARGVNAHPERGAQAASVAARRVVSLRDSQEAARRVEQIVHPRQVRGDTGLQAGGRQRGCLL